MTHLTKAKLYSSRKPMQGLKVEVGRAEMDLWDMRELAWPLEVFYLLNVAIVAWLSC